MLAKNCLCYEDAVKARNSLAHTEPADAIIPTTDWVQQFVTQNEQGNNPMTPTYKTTTNASTINISPAASANVEAKSDLQIQREYLLGRLEDSTKYYGDTTTAVRTRLSKQFHLNGPTRPASAKDLIEAIKNDRFEIDKKEMARLQNDFEEWGNEDYEDFETFARYHGGPFFGLNFLDYPKPDRKAFDAAIEEFSKATQAAKDIVMIGTPEAGLAAIVALESWQPTGVAN